MKNIKYQQLKIQLFTLSLLSLGLQNSKGTIQKSESVYKKPNILLLVSEDNGPQLGCYGDPFARTPNLDYLGKEGVIFEKAYVTQAGCSPSRASIFTGSFPHENGHIGLASHGFRLYEENTFNFINALKESGYRTAILGKIHVNPESAFNLDEWIKGDSFGKRNVQEISANAMKFITKNDQPFFLMVNYADAHRPFIKQDEGLPRDPYKKGDVDPLTYFGFTDDNIEQQIVDYYNCIERLDEGIGILINALKKTGKYENTLIVYLSDHGAEFLRGKMTPYEGGTRIPLLIKWNDNFKAGQRREELVSTIDLVPTFLEVAKIKCPKSLNGNSLLPLLQGEKIPWRDYLFTEYHVHSVHNLYPSRGVRDKKYKLIVNLLHGQPNPEYTHRTNLYYGGALYIDSILKLAPIRIQNTYNIFRKAPEYELYDLENDPYEFNNLAFNESYDEVLEHLKTVLQAWREETKDPLLCENNLHVLKKQVDSCYQNGEYIRPNMQYWTFYDIWKSSRINPHSPK